MSSGVLAIGWGVTGLRGAGRYQWQIEGTFESGECGMRAACAVTREFGLSLPREAR